MEDTKVRYFIKRLSVDIHLKLTYDVHGMGMGFLRDFQQLRSYRDEIENWNLGEIPFSLRIVPRGLPVAEEP